MKMNKVTGLKKNILCVDDNEDTCWAVKIILTNAGYHVEYVLTGKKALTMTQAPFDVIILDLVLPDMSGLEVFNEFKRRAAGTSFVFLVTEPIEEKLWDEMMSAGVCNFISKPFTKQELINKIKVATEEEKM